MFRSILPLVLFVWVFCQAQAEDEEILQSCVAWGDPHVSRFPSEQSEKVTEAWCQESGWKQLLKNEYINAKVLISGKPYVITKFILKFLDDDEQTSDCLVTESRFSSPSGQCGSDVTITNNGNSLTILYKKRDITITVQKYDYIMPGTTHGYSITILQPPYLIPMSTGLCKTSCDLNTGKALTRRSVTNDGSDSNLNSIQKSASKICEIAISKLVPEFKITSLNEMNMETKNAYKACVTDVRVSGDLTFAKNAVSTLAISLATKNLPVKTNLQPILNKAYALIEKLNPLIDSALAQFKNPTGNKDDLTIASTENEDILVSCLKSYSGVIKIVSATYKSLSTSCSWDATARVKQICASSPRKCIFNASNNVLGKNPCKNELKQLKVIYQCITRS